MGHYIEEVKLSHASEDGCTQTQSIPDREIAWAKEIAFAKVN